MPLMWGGTAPKGRSLPANLLLILSATSLLSTTCPNPASSYPTARIEWAAKPPSLGRDNVLESGTGGHLECTLKGGEASLDYPSQAAKGMKEQGTNYHNQIEIDEVDATSGVLSLRLRGGMDLFGGGGTTSDQYWMRSADIDEGGGMRGPVDRIITLLRQGMGDAEIAAHPSLRGWTRSNNEEFVSKVRAAWEADCTGKEEMEMQDNIRQANKASIKAVRAELGGEPTPEEVERRHGERLEQQRRREEEQGAHGGMQGGMGQTQAQDYAQSVAARAGVDEGDWEHGGFGVFKIPPGRRARSPAEESEDGEEHRGQRASARPIAKIPPEEARPRNPSGESMRSCSPPEYLSVPSGPGQMPQGPMYSPRSPEPPEATGFPNGIPFRPVSPPEADEEGDVGMRKTPRPTESMQRSGGSHDGDDWLGLVEGEVGGGDGEFEMPEYLLPKEERERRAKVLEKERQPSPERDEQGFIRPFSPPPPSQDSEQDKRDKQATEEGMLVVRETPPEVWDLLSAKERIKRYEELFTKYSDKMAEFDAVHGYDEAKGSYLNLELGQVIDTDPELLPAMEAADKYAEDHPEILDPWDSDDSGRDAAQEEEGSLSVLAMRLARHARKFRPILFPNETTHYLPSLGQLNSLRNFAQSNIPTPNGTELNASANGTQEDEKVYGKKMDSSWDMPLPTHPSAMFGLEWDDFGWEQKKDPDAQGWSEAVAELMEVGGIVWKEEKLPQAATALDGVDLAVQEKMMRRYADATLLLKGFRPGAAAPRWFQRQHRQRAPPLVGTNYVPHGKGVVPGVFKNASGVGGVSIGGKAVGEGGRWGGREASWNDITVAVWVSCESFKAKLEAAITASPPVSPEDDGDKVGHRWSVRAEAKHSDLCNATINIGAGGGDHLWGNPETGAPGGVVIEGEGCMHLLGDKGKARVWGQWMLGAQSTGTIGGARCIYVGGGGAWDRVGFCVCVIGGPWVMLESDFVCETEPINRPSLKDALAECYHSVRGIPLPPISEPTMDVSVAVLAGLEADLMLLRCEITGGFRARDESQSILMECHLVKSLPTQDGASFHGTCETTMLGCIFSGHRRACVGIAGKVQVVVQECEFVGNAEATILHADFPYLPPREEKIHDAVLVMDRNIIRDGTSLWLGDRFIIRDIKERDNFIDDRIPRTFVRPGVGYFSGLHLMNKYNCSRATAMRGADMPPLFGPFQGQGKYLHVNFDMDTSRLRQAGERARVEEAGEEEETREGLFGGEARDLDSEEERQVEIRRLQELEDEGGGRGSAGFVKKVIDEGVWINGTGFELAKMLGMYEPREGRALEEGREQPVEIEGGLGKKGGKKKEEEIGQVLGSARVPANQEEADVKRMIQAIYEKRDKAAREEAEQDNPFAKEW